MPLWFVVILSLSAGLQACAAPRKSGKPRPQPPRPAAPAAPKPAAPPQSSSAAGEDGSREPDQAKRLAARIEHCRRAVYAAGSDSEGQAALDELARVLASDERIPAGALRAERDLRQGHLDGLHSGGQRVYPAPKTMAWMRGIVEALDKAIGAKRAPGKPRQ